MATSTDPARFRQGAGRPSLDFIRTLRHRGTGDATEELPDPAALTAWITQFGPGGHPPEPPTAKQVTQAHTLREAIYELIKAAREADGVASCGESARRRINEAASLPVPAPWMDGSGELRWQSDQPAQATLALVARDALDLAASPSIARVRGCANPDCGALFLDSSRPGTRRWCSMGTCGNLAKKNTLRDKASAT
jgi:predicted RNA-binding Zn ribbon-like protein